jgi:hypothetical protein
MSVGSISSASVAAAAYDALKPAGEPDTARTAAPATGSGTIADHVAAADDTEPIRSLSTTIGTLVDVYL